MNVPKAVLALLSVSSLSSLGLVEASGLYEMCSISLVNKSFPMFLKVQPQPKESLLSCATAPPHSRKSVVPPKKFIPQLRKDGE